MKHDAPVPPVVPAKRRAVERAPDLWLASWLARDDLTPSQRRRLEGERARRRATVPDRVVGVLVADEGVTPAQLEALSVVLATAGATAVHHCGVARPVHAACKRLGVPVVVQPSMRDVVRAADSVIGAPKEPVEPVAKTGVWAMIRYAKHRRLPVQVVLPTGARAAGR